MSDPLAQTDALPPQPNRPAVKVLNEAFNQSECDSPEEQILIAALRYAESNPEWFAEWHKWPSAQSALPHAAYFAGQANDELASAVLQAAAIVAQKFPDLFGAG